MSILGCMDTKSAQRPGRFGMYATVEVRAIVLAALFFAAPTPPINRAEAVEPSDASPSQKTFLDRIDNALASRDSQRIAALADTKSWREAGYPDLGDLTMTLPQAPLIRDKNLSDNSVQYRDGNGRTWRLTMRHAKETDQWLAVIHANACPRSGVQRRPDLGVQAKPAVNTWTLFECWPLPMAR
jgi:hypothetical protein